MNTSRRPLRALHGLRFFAAFHVLAFHYAPVSPGTRLAALVSRGPCSVSLFYVLSGFVLAYNYIDPPSRPRIAPWPFWGARLARIYPVYLLGLVLGAPAFWFRVAGGGGVTWNFASRLFEIGAAVVFLVQAWFPGAACVWNCPAWSLSAEVFFYLLFPWFAAASIVRTSRRLALSIGGWLLFGAVLQAALWLVVRREATALDGRCVTTWLAVGAYNPVLYMHQFFVGVGVGRIFSLQEQRWTAAPWVGLSALVAIVWILSAEWSSDAFLIANFCLTPLFAALVWSLASGAGPMARALSRPACVLLGEASYSLYLLHGPIHNFVQISQNRWFNGASPALVFWPYAASSVGACVLVFLVFEEPARKWLRSRIEILRSPRRAVGP